MYWMENCFNEVWKKKGRKYTTVKTKQTVKKQTKTVYLHLLRVSSPSGGGCCFSRRQCRTPRKRTDRRSTLKRRPESFKIGFRFLQFLNANRLSKLKYMELKRKSQNILLVAYLPNSGSLFKICQIKKSKDNSYQVSECWVDSCIWKCLVKHFSHSLKDFVSSWNVRQRKVRTLRDRVPAN